MLPKPHQKPTKNARTAPFLYHLVCQIMRKTAGWPFKRGNKLCFVSSPSYPSVPRRLMAADAGSPPPPPPPPAIGSASPAARGGNPWHRPPTPKQTGKPMKTPHGILYPRETITCTRRQSSLSLKYISGDEPRKVKALSAWRAATVFNT